MGGRLQRAGQGKRCRKRNRSRERTMDSIVRVTTDRLVATIHNHETPWKRPSVTRSTAGRAGSRNQTFVPIFVERARTRTPRELTDRFSKQRRHTPHRKPLRGGVVHAPGPPRRVRGLQCPLLETERADMGWKGRSVRDNRPRSPLAGPGAPNAHLGAAGLRAHRGGWCGS